MKKIKYILKKLFFIIFISFFSIFLYQIFIEIKNTSNLQENSNIYATKLSIGENKTMEDISNTIEKTSKSVVGISKIKNIGSSAFLTNSTQNMGLGSGIIISEKGYILTNQHVAGEKDQRCYVTIESGDVLNGKIIWANEDIDLAIIKVESSLGNVAIIGDSNGIETGNNVYAIGNPIGYEFQRTVTAGIISAVDRTVKVKNDDETYSYMSNLIQTDATINPGNSGGPLINEKGEVIGINTIKITSAEGIGFAIPINIVKPIIEKIEKNEEFNEAYIGIYAYDGQVMTYINRDIKNNQGIYVEEIVKNSPADGTEIEKGDIITQIDNTSVNKMSELQAYIFEKEPGDEIILKVLRNNENLEIKIILGEKN